MILVIDTGCKQTGYDIKYLYVSTTGVEGFDGDMFQLKSTQQPRIFCSGASSLMLFSLPLLSETLLFSLQQLVFL